MGVVVDESKESEFWSNRMQDAQEAPCCQVGEALCLWYGLSANISHETVPSSYCNEYPRPCGAST